jgi:hypothetical protein
MPTFVTYELLEWFEFHVLPSLKILLAEPHTLYRLARRDDYTRSGRRAPLLILR